MDADHLRQHPHGGSAAGSQQQLQSGDATAGVVLTDAQRAALLQEEPAQLHLGELTPERIAAQKLQLQEAARVQHLRESGRTQSWMETPVAMRGSAPWQGDRSAPREAAISESPTQPENPASQGAPGGAQHQIPAQTAPPPTTQSPPLAVSVDVGITHQQPMSQGAADTPISQHHSPHTITSTYKPHADALNSPASTHKTSNGTSPITATKSALYAPDDLVHVHHQAALAQGRTPTLPSAAAAADLREHAPGQIAHPNQRRDSNGKDEWRHGLFACAPDADTCCLGLFCPCVVHARTARRLSRRADGLDPTDMLGHSACGGQCVLGAGLCCLLPIITRARVRHIYKIRGGVGGDVVRGCCCCCCVVVQSEREMKEREESRRRFEGPAGGGGGYGPPVSEMVYRPGGV